jgi:hypothetical protein
MLRDKRLADLIATFGKQFVLDNFFLMIRRPPRSTQGKSDTG